MTGPAQYRKKPVVIEAMRWQPDDEDARMAMWEFVGDAADPVDADGTPVLEINTLEGPLTAQPGDFIIRGVKGEFYPCKPDIFEATYQAELPEEVAHEPAVAGELWTLQLRHHDGVRVFQSTSQLPASLMVTASKDRRQLFHEALDVLIAQFDAMGVTP